MASPDPTLLDVTCTACGCLCDDIGIFVDHDRIVRAERACPVGVSWFLADHSHRDIADATIEGRPASLDEAIGRSAAILKASRSPLILGLTRATLEAQAEAVAIADRLGATIDPAGSADSLPRWRAIQRVGMVSATWGEVRDRADVVIFWGVDPIATHPRHFERYSVDAIGRFVPEGRAGRFVAVVGGAPNATSARADLFVTVPCPEDVEALSILRALVRGKDVPASDSMRALASAMVGARYGAFVFGAGLEAAEAALTLVRDLNGGGNRRFVALALGSAGNPTGAEATLTWQAGSPVAVDFSRGFPRYLPDEATAEARLRSRRADSALIVADDPRDFLSAEALANLATIPTIAVGPRATDPSRPATVAIASATFGIHEGGDVMRSDGPALPLRPALKTDRPPLRRLLAEIRRVLGGAEPRRE